MLRITGIALLTATVVAILGCGGGSPSPAPASPPPAPSISISPTSAVAGGPDLTLTVLGSNFLGETHNFSQAVWSANSSNTLLATTFVSSTQLTAVIPSALLTNAITGQVFVQTGDPMGDIPLRKSDSVSFSVTIPSPGVPSISSISPTSAVVGSPDLTLTVTGSNFVNANRYHNVVAWSVNGNDTSLATTFVSSTQLTAVIPASLLLNPTAAKVSVQTWYFDNDIPTSVSNSVSFSVTSSGAFVSNSSATRRPEDMRQLAANPVLEWNQTAITAALAADQTTAPGSATQGGSGIYLAYVHLAIFNAVNTIDHRYHSYGTELVEQKGASKKAAIASAGYHMLVSLLPDQAATLATEYSNALGAIPDSTAKNRGIHVGQAAAFAIFALRANDGRGANVTYTFPASPEPGAWIPTPPGFLPPLTPWVGQMVPFTMSSASEFLPTDGPSDLGSAQWVNDYNETKRLGSVGSTARTPQQTEIGLFWTAHAGAMYAPAFRKLAADRHLNISDSARLFAMLYTAYADSFIGCLNAKYHFGFWRPVTAVQNAEIDGNPETAPDPTWLPLGATPNHPEFPAAHGCVTGAVAKTVELYFGTPKVGITVSSNITNTTHAFTDTRDWQKEVLGARIYSGFHYRHSLDEGFRLGHEVAEQIERKFFLPLPGRTKPKISDD